MDNEQEERPKGVLCSEAGAEDTVNTHEGEVSEGNKADEGCDEQERQRKPHTRNVTEAIARYCKSQGDQAARHPRLLNRGEPTGRKDDRETHPKPPRVEATIPTRRKQANPAKARLRKPRPGEQNRKNETFLNLHAFRRVKAVTTGGTEKMAQKRRRGTTGTTMPITRHGGNPCQVIISKKIAKLDSFN